MKPSFEQHCLIRRPSSHGTSTALPAGAGHEETSPDGGDVGTAAPVVASEQFFHRDGEATHSHAGRVIHSVCNRGRHGYGSQFAETLCAERARFLVELTDEEDVELRE